MFSVLRSATILKPNDLVSRRSLLRLYFVTSTLTPVAQYEDRLTRQDYKSRRASLPRMVRAEEGLFRVVCFEG
jgi:hypothetical protein